MIDETKTAAAEDAAQQYCDRYYTDQANFPIEIIRGSNSPAMKHFLAGRQHFIDAELPSQVAAKDTEIAELQAGLKTQIRWTDEAIAREEQRKQEVIALRRDRDKLQRRLEARWISVETEQPNRDDYYLTRIKGMRKRIVARWDQGRWMIGRCNSRVPVTHFCELPPLPVVDQEPTP